MRTRDKSHYIVEVSFVSIVKNVHNVKPVMLHKETVAVRRILSTEMKTISFLDWDLLEPGATISPHPHPFLEEIYVIIKGKGSIRLGSEEKAVDDGSVVYIPPGTIHSLRNAGKEPITFLCVAAHAFPYDEEADI